MLGRKPITGLGLLALATVLAFGPGLLTTADETPEAAQDAATAGETIATAPTRGALGMIVVIDEETGKLRAPTVYELDELTSQNEQYWADGSDLETTKGPGNSVILKLDSRFHKFAVAEIPEAEDSAAGEHPLQPIVQHDVVLVDAKTLAEASSDSVEEDGAENGEPVETAQEVTP